MGVITVGIADCQTSDQGSDTLVTHSLGSCIAVAIHDPAAEVAEILDEQVSGAVLPDLQIVAARVDPAEDSRKPGDEQVVLRDVPPRLLARQRPRGEAPEVLGAPERVACQQLRLHGPEQFVGGHALSSPAATAAPGHRGRTALPPQHPVKRAAGPPTTGGGALKKPFGLDGSIARPYQLISSRKSLRSPTRTSHPRDGLHR